MSNRQALIRNFAIIAHIDHGKSTLADRIMEMTNTVSERETEAQLLDDLSVEKPHGVTVKSAPFVTTILITLALSTNTI